MTRIRLATMAMLLSSGAASVGCGVSTDEGSAESSLSDAAEGAVRAVEASVASGTTTTIIGVGSGLCVGVKGSSTAAGATIQQQGCSGSAFQNWTASLGSDGYYNLKNSGSGLCLEVPGGSTVSGTVLQQASCGTGTSQKFSITDKGSSQFAIISAASNLALDVVGGSTSNGTAIQQWGYGGNTNQLWKFGSAAVGTPNLYADASNTVEVYVNGTSLGKTSSAAALLTASAQLNSGAENVIAIRATKGSAGNPAMHAQLNGAFGTAGSSTLWLAKLASTSDELTGSAWAATTYGDAAWSAAKDVSVAPTNTKMTNGPAKGIWSNSASDATVLFRTRIYLPTNQSASAADGFARGVTGGAGGSVVTVTTPAELKAALADNTARIVQVSGTIDFRGTESTVTKSVCQISSCTNGQYQYMTNDLAGCGTRSTFNYTFDAAGPNPLPVGSNKTIIGLGNNATIKGKGLTLKGGVSNIIIRNLTITQINPEVVWGGDAITIDNADRVWIDHNRVSLIGRQFLVTGWGKASNVTVSYNEFDGTTPYSCTCNGAHYWTFLMAGGADTITMQGNWIHNTSGRGPHAGGLSTENVKAHFVNDYYQNVPGHAADSDLMANLLFEGSYFQAVTTPFTTGYKGAAFAPVASNVSSAGSSCSSLLGRACVANGTNSTTITSYPLDAAALSAFGDYDASMVTPYPANEVPYAVPHFAGPGHL